MEKVDGDQEETFWSRFAVECGHCKEICAIGTRIYPIKTMDGRNEFGRTTWIHFECAKELAVVGDLSKRPTCKHWLQKGSCMFGDQCFYLHPPQQAGKIGKSMFTGTGRRIVHNDGRGNVFRRFVVQTFGEEVLRQGAGILDVAGGKGEVSFVFENLGGMRCTVVDPRPLDLRSSIRRFNYGMYHRNRLFSRKFVNRDWKQGLRSVPHVRMYLDRPLVDALREGHSANCKDLIANNLERSKTLVFTEKGLHEGELSEEEDSHMEDADDTDPDRHALTLQHSYDIEDIDTIHHLLTNFSAILGMHPDQATGAIVDLALQFNKPFAVVPCCVYRAQFPKRKLKDGTIVRNYSLLIEYLKQKHPRIQSAKLDFEGKNTVLYYNPDPSHQANKAALDTRPKVEGEQ